MTSTTTRTLRMAAFATVLLVAACERSPSGDAAPSGAAGGMPAMPNMPQTTQQPQHVGQGTLNSVDQAAGTVNISHGPIASANWPAMSMSFKLANPSAASGLEAGQRVEFRFTIASGMDATVTELKRVE
jgi:Cu(I)/Ag(I) efflux system periplasmic protein CusF